MTHLDHKDELSELRRKLLRISVLEFPGPVLVGLAIYGKYSMGAAFHPLLNNATFTTGMIVVGGIIMAWGISQLLPLMRRISALEINRGAGER